MLHDDHGQTGTGLAFTLGEGTDFVCAAARFYAQRLVGGDIDEVMADFGARKRAMANEQQFRWLGLHKGIVQLALASVTNACWDLWAKSRGVPLWKLLLDLSPEELVATLDLSYLEDELNHEQALALLRDAQPTRARARAYCNRDIPDTTPRSDDSIIPMNRCARTAGERSRRVREAGK